MRPGAWPQLLAAALGGPPTIDQDQLERLMRVTPVVSVMASIGAAVACVPFIGRPGAGAALAWFVVFVTMSLLRIVFARYYLQRVAPGGSSRTWYRVAAAGSLGHAVLWGLCSLVLLDPGAPQTEAILHVVLAAVAMGAAVHLSGFYPLLVSFTLLVIAPLVLRDVWIGGTFHLLLAFMSAMIGLYALLNSRNQSQAIAEILAQRRRNAELIDALRRENTAANEARQAAEQANAAKARLFAAANHDLRQPLHAMGLMAQTLRAPRAPGIDVDAAALRIGECVDSLGHLVDAMLDLSRLDSGSVQARPMHFAINGLFDEMANTYGPLAEAKGLRLRREFSDAVVRADRALVGRVLHNLVANAVRYTPDGEVVLRTEAGPEAALSIVVEDTGIGIPAEQQPRIFEEFYQVGNAARQRGQGLGLGLATARRISDLLGLKLRVSSEPGRGSTFRFDLPRGHEALRVKGAPVADDGNLLAGRRVLVLEDDPPSREALVQWLQSWGCIVRAAPDALAAMRIVDQGYQPDAAIADLRLAEGVNGEQALMQLRERLDPGLPAVIVTGDATRDALCGEGETALPVLRKPVRPMQLRAFLQAAFAPRDTDHVAPLLAGADEGAWPLPSRPPRGGDPGALRSTPTPTIP